MKIVIETNHVDYTGGGKYSRQLATLFSKFGEVYIRGEIPHDSKRLGQDFNFTKYNNSFNPDLFIAISHFGGIEPIGKKNVHACMYPMTSQLNSKVIDSYKHYDYAICLNNFIKTEQEEKWGLPASIINPYVDNSLFISEKKENIILSVGNYFFLPDEYDNSKNQHLILDWFLSNKIYLKYRLIMTGSIIVPEYYEQILEKAFQSELSVSTNNQIIENSKLVIWHDISFNLLRELYSRSKYLVHAMGYKSVNNYATEHFGLVAIEAMAAGCQPIVHNSGGCKNLKGVRTWNDFPDIIPLMNEVNTEQLQEYSKQYSFENSLRQTEEFLELIY